MVRSLSSLSIPVQRDKSGVKLCSQCVCPIETTRYLRKKKKRINQTCEKEQFWHRGGEKEGRQTLEPTLPIFFCLGKLYSPGEDALLFRLCERIQILFYSFQSLSKTLTDDKRKLRSKRPNLLVILLCSFLAGFFFCFLIFLFFYNTFTNAIRHP